jgi:hypothetical protein
MRSVARGVVSAKDGAGGASKERRSAAVECTDSQAWMRGNKDKACLWTTATANSTIANDVF